MTITYNIFISLRVPLLLTFTKINVSMTNKTNFSNNIIEIEIWNNINKKEKVKTKGRENKKDFLVITIRCTWFIVIDRS